MARITVEDCVTIVPNRFELCLIASNRAKSILSGAKTNMDKKEKPAVIALREIADYVVDIEQIKKNIVKTIKNRGVSDQDIVNIDSGTKEAFESEQEENQAAMLKDTIFVEDNVEIDD